MRMTLRDIQGSEYTKNTAFDECALRSAGVRVALRDSFQGPREMAPIIRCCKRACSVSRRYMADGSVDIISIWRDVLKVSSKRVRWFDEIGRLYQYISRDLG